MPLFDRHDTHSRHEQAAASAPATSIWPLARLIFILGVAIGLLALLDASRARAETVSSASMDAASQPKADIPQPPGKPPLPADVPAGPAGYRALVEAEAVRAGLPPEIADSVMAVESGYNAGAIGGVGEIGLMQILPSTARMLGFSGTLAELAVPQTNIHYGVAYLAKAWRLAGGDLCTATMKYRAGHGETRFSHLSVNYCLAVRGKLAARGFRVTGSVPVATFGGPAAGGSVSCKRRCLGGTGIGRIDLAGLNTKLSALVVQVRAGR